MKDYNFKLKTKFLAAFMTLIFLCPVLLFSCAEEDAAAIDLKKLSEVIAEKVDLSNTIEYSDEQVRNNYGVTPEDIINMTVLKEMDVNSAEVLILFEAKDKEKAKEIENKLKEHKTYKLNELKDYTLNPDNERQYHIIEESEIIVERQYVFWAVYSQSKEINAIINDFINEK